MEIPSSLSSVEYVETLIRVSPKPIEKFENICHDAWGMACANKMGVLFDFNGHEGIVYPDTDIEKFQNEFWDHIQGNAEVYGD